MHIGVMGTGDVGQTIVTKLVQLGIEVMMGSRDAANPKAIAWSKQEQEKHALFGTFADTASFGEIIFNCTMGSASLAALRLAGAENFKARS
jgi:predicted dinucleotide-binding enzyme